MELINLDHSGYDIDFAIMAFCGDSRSLSNFELYVSDFKSSTSVKNNTGQRDATRRRVSSR